MCPEHGSTGALFLQKGEQNGTKNHCFMGSASLFYKNEKLIRGDRRKKSSTKLKIAVLAFFYLVGVVFWTQRLSSFHCCGCGSRDSRVCDILIGYLIRVRVGGARSSRARPGTGFENSFTALQAFYPELTSPGVGLQSLCSPV